MRLYLALYQIRNNCHQRNIGCCKTSLKVRYPHKNDSLQLFVRRFMSYLRYLCFFAYSGVQHIVCCVFVLFVFVLCTLYCQFLWIILVILSSSCVPYIASFSGLFLFSLSSSCVPYIASFSGLF